MEITVEQYSEIQKYIDGEMTGAQESDFLRQLSQNRELRDSYEFEKYIRLNVPPLQEAEEMIALSKQDGGSSGENEDAPRVKELIGQAGREWRQENPDTATAPKIFSLRRWTNIAVAACLVIAVGVIVYFLTPDKVKIARERNNALVAQYFKKDDPPASVYPALEKALKDYKDGNYTTIQNYDLKNFPILKGGEDQRQKTLEQGYYYQGISYMETGDPLKATTSLQWVIDNGLTQDLVTKAQWYESLCFIKISDIPHAAGLLVTLSSNNAAGEYQRQATELIEKLLQHGH
ncbi:MAG TPA: hypothetical protein VE035_00650 [Puia sp.]|nr:hypothetical protein [Puia sp.]